LLQHRLFHGGAAKNSYQPEQLQLRTQLKEAGLTPTANDPLLEQ
jgi:hypothetical protein